MQPSARTVSLPAMHTLGIFHYSCNVPCRGGEGGHPFNAAGDDAFTPVGVRELRGARLRESRCLFVPPLSLTLTHPAPPLCLSLTHTVCVSLSFFFSAPPPPPDLLFLSM